MPTISRRRADLEPAEEYQGAYCANGWEGVAWRVDGWETSMIGVWQCPDCDYLQYERDGGGGWNGDKGDADCEHEHAYCNDEPEHERTGRLACHMVGDDATFYFDPSDLEPIDDDDYCGECGQIGCGHG